MGWDITDFGSADFARRGLVIFCVRNGRQGVADEKPYAEKLLVVGEDQETPYHHHRIKMEDIIVRRRRQSDSRALQHARRRARRYARRP